MLNQLNNVAALFHLICWNPYGNKFVSGCPQKLFRHHKDRGPLLLSLLERKMAVGDSQWIIVLLTLLLRKMHVQSQI